MNYLTITSMKLTGILVPERFGDTLKSYEDKLLIKYKSYMFIWHVAIFLDISIHAFIEVTKNTTLTEMVMLSECGVISILTEPSQLHLKQIKYHVM
jgi:hypothetical protein